MLPSLGRSWTSLTPLPPDQLLDGHISLRSMVDSGPVKSPTPDYQVTHGTAAPKVSDCDVTKTDVYGNSEGRGSAASTDDTRDRDSRTHWTTGPSVGQQDYLKGSGDLQPGESGPEVRGGGLSRNSDACRDRLSAAQVGHQPIPVMAHESPILPFASAPTGGDPTCATTELDPLAGAGLDQPANRGGDAWHGGNPTAASTGSRPPSSGADSLGEKVLCRNLDDYLMPSCGPTIMPREDDEMEYHQEWNYRAHLQNAGVPLAACAQDPLLAQPRSSNASSGQGSAAYWTQIAAERKHEMDVSAADLTYATAMSTSRYSPGREVTHTKRELRERCRVLASQTAKQCFRIAVFGGRA